MIIYSPGRFEGKNKQKGMYYIKLTGLEGVEVSHEYFKRGTIQEGTPIHITLGWPDFHLERQTERELASMVNGTRTMNLKKWSRRAEATAYIPVGSVHRLCQELSDLYGFMPRGEWHVTL